MNESKVVFDYTNYMTIEALEDDVSISFPRTIEYGINGVGWEKLYRGQEIVINKGVFLSVRYLLPEGGEFGNILISGGCNLKGNCLSLVFYNNASKNNNLSAYIKGLRSLFVNCGGIKNVDVNFLPATVLADYCYAYMFSGCTSLTTAPELPATTLAKYCYSSMFENCTSLISTPELPATTLTEYCYDGMFYDCTSLTTPIVLPATTLANYCYQHMFRGCTNLKTAPKLPATTLATSCYCYMFYGCTSLITAPELPATTLANYCYQYMFEDCSKLNYIKMLATDISAFLCLYGWVRGVASSGTFVKHPDMTTLPTATSSNYYTGIPKGWTVVNDGEESGGNLITFTVDGIEYQAEEGMTWKEWCNSEYNTAGFIYDWSDNGNGIYTSNYEKYFIYGLNDSSLVTNGVYLTKTVDWPM